MAETDDGFVGCRIDLRQSAQRVVVENHTEAVGSSGLLPLEHGHAGLGSAHAEEPSGEQAGRPSAQDCDAA
jgi:hypothetical protein